MRRIIIKDAQSTAVDPLTFSVSYVLRLRAPANRIIPKPSATSVVTDATEAEVAELRAGTYTETTGSHAGFTAETLPDVLAALATDFAAAQSAIDDANPPFGMILSSWDGISWSASE